MRVPRAGLIALFVWVAVCAGVFKLWEPLDLAEEDRLRRITYQMSMNVRGDVLGDVTAQLRADEHLAQTVTAQSPLLKTESSFLSRVLYDRDPADVGVLWIDRSHSIVWETTRGDPRTTAGPSRAEPALAALLQTVQQSATRGAMISRAYPTHGRPVAWRVTPTGGGAADGGFLVVAFDVAASLDRTLEEERDLGYSVAVVEDGREIFRTTGANPENERRWAQEADLALPGTLWRIRVWPGDRVIAGVRTPLPELGMVLGVLLGVLATLSVRYVRAAQVNSRQLQHARDLLEERVQARTTELQQLSGQLLRLQDDERRRIARELHDSVSQSLTALGINLDSARRAVEGSNGGALGSLRDSADLVEGLIRETRTLSYLLHPPMLDDLGLAYVLPWYASGFSKRSGIHVRVQVPPDIERLSPDIELTLFRVTQEALTNVYRHAACRSVDIDLTRTGTTVTLTISDDGHGFPIRTPHESSDGDPMLGVGIAGMRERVRQFDGRLQILSRADGTRILVTLPLAPTTAATGS